jgi:hypothetical protein
MNSKIRPGGPFRDEMIDHLAKRLPDKLRADYHREVRYCRSLPENDEMLRILSIMQILTLLMQDVPDRVVTERVRLEQLFKAGIDSLEKMVRSSEAYQKQLDSRISHLPEEIFKHLNPAAIAARINESLHQQFEASALPQTAQALALLARGMKATTAEFKQAADSLGNAYRGVVTDATRSIEEIRSAISRATNDSRLAARDLTDAFHQEYRWSVYVLTFLALVIGLALGIIFYRWLGAPATGVKRALVPAIQSASDITAQARPRR